ncbi:hypothetical protein Bpfe_002330, partial [Biomphalaria pfeifferi]
VSMELKLESSFECLCAMTLTDISGFSDLDGKSKLRVNEKDLIIFVMFPTPALSNTGNEWSRETWQKQSKMRELVS